MPRVGFGALTVGEVMGDCANLCWCQSRRDSARRLCPVGQRSKNWANWAQLRALPGVGCRTKDSVGIGIWVDQKGGRAPDFAIERGRREGEERLGPK
ncbi:hypothetical protein PAXRUDRAFT_214347 [Paxillus rubicundulus Ve08.2h10]|uniref:Uncharacterized protein n=1 Tax=Paxillus rubicundulus Ve08.2h10 TaxID=930991 RepID=A0A0D0E7A6_9AGAM|nr:hypothetical protein PAXRUDRAFT_214347 [Paxillus rubicundulus Ve08.2h10]